jgi:epidermal growth factor receptor kinase substrate 8
VRARTLSVPRLQFPLDLVADPTAHLSGDPRDVYNNILLFIVREDKRAGARTVTPTEMHIFQCNRISAQELVQDIMQFLRGLANTVKP